MANLAQELNAALAARGLSDLAVTVLETVDSTNSECARLFRDGGAARRLVLAEGQTAGRGRVGRGFYSPPGSGLYLTLGLPLPARLEDAADYTCFAAVAVSEEIERLCGLRCGIKWVNDLYLEGRKVCGILTEAVGDHLILGVGVNLAPSAVPEELRDIMGWLGRSEARVPLAAALAARVFAHRPGDRSHMEEYRRRCIVLGRTVEFVLNGVNHRGLAETVLDDGALKVNTPEGPVLLRSGEVSLRVT